MGITRRQQRDMMLSWTCLHKASPYSVTALAGPLDPLKNSLACVLVVTVLIESTPIAWRSKSRCCFPCHGTIHGRSAEFQLLK